MVVETLSTDEPDPLSDVGFKLAATPFTPPRTFTLRLTVPANPFNESSAIVLVPVAARNAYVGGGFYVLTDRVSGGDRASGEELQVEHPRLSPDELRAISIAGCAEVP